MVNSMRLTLLFLLSLLVNYSTANSRIRPLMSPPPIGQKVTTTTAAAYRLSDDNSILECDDNLVQLIEKCARELVELGALVPADGAAGSPLTLSDMRNRTRHHFLELCSAYSRYNGCLSGSEEFGLPAMAVKQICYVREPHKSRFAVADAALNYVCGEGFNAMLINWDCFIRTSSSAEFLACEEAFSGPTAAHRPVRFESELETQLMDFSYTTNVCRSLKSFVDCVRLPVQMSCGDAALQTVVGAIEKPVHVYLPFCTLSSARPGLFAAAALIPLLLRVLV